MFSAKNFTDEQTFPLSALPMYFGLWALALDQ
jgi:hypothetical protein